MQLQDEQIHFLNEYVKLLEVGLEGLQFVKDQDLAQGHEVSLQVFADFTSCLDQLNKGLPHVQELLETSAFTKDMAQVLEHYPALSDFLEKKEWTSFQATINDTIFPAYQDFSEKLVAFIQPHITH